MFRFITCKFFNKRIYGRTIAAFFITLFFCSVLVFAGIAGKMDIERLEMEQLIIEKSVKANENLTRLLYKTQILSTFVLSRGGICDDFEQVAAMIVDDPAIQNILIAPDGVVSNVYPLEGNEAVLGLDFFGEGAGNKEAAAARDTGRLVFGGPFNAVQGGQILVGRQPVFLSSPDGTEVFWGIVSVTLKYPDALEAAGFSELKYQGYSYEIWRINPDNNEKQIIAGSDEAFGGNRYIEKHVKIQDADWFFRILPIRAWYQYSDTWLLLFLSLFISILLAYVIQSNSELEILKSQYELLSQTDSLTGIHNRRYFMSAAGAVINSLSGTDTRAFIIIFDIDHFKKINDKYGHSVGDDVIRGIVGRVSDTLRPCDLFSRYGGEEFILLVSDISKDDVLRLAERVRKNIASEPIICGQFSIPVTSSFGIADLLPDKNLDKVIDCADKALYTAKNTGRNKVVFYEPANHI